jgi:hypothetical protein
VDLPSRLLADPAAFTRAYRPRRRRSPAAEVARAARLLAGHGVTVEARPSVPDPAGVVPDLLLDGRRFDCVTPHSDDARQVATVLEIRVVRGTATRFVLDLDHTDVDLQVLRRQLDRFPVPGLDEVIVLRGGRALRFFP